MEPLALVVVLIVEEVELETVPPVVLLKLLSVVPQTVRLLPTESSESEKTNERRNSVVPLREGEAASELEVVLEEESEPSENPTTRPSRAVLAEDDPEL